MSVLIKLQTLLRDPKTIIWSKIFNRFAPFFSDEQWIRMQYRYWFGGAINLNTPQTFNEKLNWLKLYDRNPRYTQLADKFAVKQLVTEIIGEQYVVPCYGVWNNFDEIDFDALPQRFVLKCNHNSGGVFLCNDKSGIDKDSLREMFSNWQKKDFFLNGREWPYKDIHRRILAEELLDDGSGHELRDYKFWCFNGEPKVMYITNKARDIYENFYDMNFKPIDINHGFKRTVPEYDCPTQFELMKNLAGKLSAGIPFVRVDFFVVNKQVYFGEFTFYDWGGFRPFKNKETDMELGKMLILNTCRNE